MVSHDQIDRTRNNDALVEARTVDVHEVMRSYMKMIEVEKMMSVMKR